MSWQSYANLTFPIQDISQQSQENMSTYGTEGKTAAILSDTVTEFSHAMKEPTDHHLSGQ